MATHRKKLLLNRLRNTDADVRARAADRLREEVSPDPRRAVIDRLVDQLSDRYDNTRWQAARALGVIGSARSDVLSALTSRLNDSHEYVRRCVAEALGRIVSGPEDIAEQDDVIDALNACLDDDSEEVRRVARRALEAIVGRTDPPSRCSGGPNGRATEGEICEGNIYDGEVKAIKDYGALVEIVSHRVGLLHVSEIDYGHVENVDDYCRVGDRVRVKLLEVTSEGKLLLTRKPFIEPSPWDDLEEEYSVGDTVSGEVVSIQEFGAFVDLEAGITGLIHVSEMKEEYVDHPSDVVSIGQQVKTEILEINAEDEKIRLRLKRSKPKKQAGGNRAVQGSRYSNGRRSEDGDSGREVLLVDGSNVCRNWPASEREASLNVLLTLLLELVDRGFDFECIFDANIPHVLRDRAESGAEDARKRLAGDLPGRMSRVPGGEEADDPILQKADERDLRVVTNDRFQEEEKREKYPWIDKRESERLIKGSVHGTDLQVCSLDLFTEVRTDTQRMADELLWATREIDDDGSQGHSTRFRGKVKFFDAKKGFGFIEPLGHDEDVYVQADNLSGATAGKDLKEGQGIEFGVEQGAKGPKALDASPVRQ
jgi:predicted RNA-binding protein with RPS1 domain/cold shock CspA family protein